MKSFVKMVFIFILALPLVGQANHSWNGYHWARTQPNPVEFPNNPYRFNLKVVDNLTPDWKSTLGLAMTDWNSPQNFDLAPFTNLTTPVNLVFVKGFYPNKKCNTVTGTTQVCNSAYGRNGWLGLATIYLSGLHITKGTAKMNDSYFNSTFPKYNNIYERQHVLCQEVAHTFGLGHQSEDFNLSLSTCMDYSSSNEGDKRSTHPNEHDFVMLNSIYNHYDSFNSYSTSAMAPSLAMGPDPVDHNDPNSWGQLVSQSRDGRSSTYERVHGPNSKSVTEVYWTEETAADCPSCDHRFHHDD